jgi:uncharacterized heparinase superfamily protein
MRHLKPQQVYGRVWRCVYNPAADTSPAPPLRQPLASWTLCRGHQPQLLGPETFRFLNNTRTLTGPGDWNSPFCDKLWLYNVHYFNDLTAEDFLQRARWHHHVLERWVKENPPTEGNGWEPYPLSLRIVNWIKWALAGGDLNTAFVSSLAVQARYLSRRLEYHLMGNHLLANAKALIFAGSFYTGIEADRWLSAGLEVLQFELREQFLGDGGHFERSPMYHSILTEDLLDLIQLRNLYPKAFASCSGPVFESFEHRDKLGWLATMTHPDGEITFFNDSATRIASRAAELEDYAACLGLACTPQSDASLAYLKDSGYVRIRDGSAALFIDVGCLGPDYLPAHAHADTLSFELSLDGRRVFVNSGTSTYTGKLRQWQRGTAAHNSVTVDEMDSSEVWSSFRVARRARPLDVIVDEGHVSAGHDGYCRLSGSPVHRRTYKLRGGRLQIKDMIQGAGQHRVALHFHAAPGLTVVRDGSRWLLYERGTFVASLHFLEGTRSEVEVVDTEYYPEFGLAVPNRTIIARWQGLLPFCGETSISWRKEG